MLENLFKFPIVKIDGDNEDRKYKAKERFGDLTSTEHDDDYDMVFGWAEYPYWDIIGLEDSWLPQKESLERAMGTPAKFDACIVRFANVGQLLVPMTRKEFKKSIQDFAEKFEASRPKQEQKALVNVRTLTIEEAKKLLGEGPDEKS